MTSNLALSMTFTCFLPVLLPSYVLSVGGTATDVWVAMSMAGLLALLGPSIGRLAGRRRAHRLVQVLGMLGMTVGLLGLAISHGDSLSIVLAIAVMGVGAAAVTIAAPTFILSSKLPADIQSRQLTWLQLNLDLGKIVGGLLLGVMATAKLPLHTQFRVGGLVMGLVSLLVWTTSRRATRRIHKLEVDPAAASEPGTVVSWRTLLLSLFGVPIVAQLLADITVAEAQISTMLMMSGLVGIGLYFLASRWMTRSGPGLAWATGHALRGAGGVVLGVLGLVRGQPYLVMVAAFLVLESAPAIAWLVQARRAATPEANTPLHQSVSVPTSASPSAVLSRPARGQSTAMTLGSVKSARGRSLA